MEEQLIQGYIPQGVSIDPKIIGKDYLPIWVEYAAQKYQQIIRTKTDGGTYTIPQGQILFITSAHLGGVGRIWFLGADVPAIENDFIRSNHGAPISSTFSMPLRFDQGVVLHWETAAGTYGGFEGFLIDVIPQSQL